MPQEKIVFLQIVDGTEMELRSLINLLAPLQKSSGYKFMAGRREITSVGKEDLIRLVESLKNDNPEDNK